MSSATQEAAGPGEHATWPIQGPSCMLGLALWSFCESKREQTAKCSRQQIINWSRWTYFAAPPCPPRQNRFNGASSCTSTHFGPRKAHLVAQAPAPGCFQHAPRLLGDAEHAPRCLLPERTGVGLISDRGVGREALCTFYTSQELLALPRRCIWSSPQHLPRNALFMSAGWQ
jgi:hypothetical protein